MANVNPRLVLLVAAGGVIGTAARLGLGLVIADDQFPAAVLAANILGALLIGILTARLPHSDGLRVFLGTGILGGFTTYSALAVGSIVLWQEAPAMAAGYVAASLALGVAAAALGLRLGRPRPPRGAQS